MRHHRDRQPMLITDAPKSLDDDFDRRRKRYAIMMGLRALCVIAAALTYHVSWVLAALLVVGGAILPWAAVILANDRPPKKSRRTRRYRPPDPTRALPPRRDDRTIEG